MSLTRLTIRNRQRLKLVFTSFLFAEKFYDEDLYEEDCETAHSRRQLPFSNIDMTETRILADNRLRMNTILTPPSYEESQRNLPSSREIVIQPSELHIESQNQPPPPYRYHEARHLPRIVLDNARV